MSQQVVSSQQAASVEQWLKRHGFQANPFADQEADRERRLPEYFVETPYYDDILGDPANPRSLVVYAGRGCGKSAHRLRVGRACRPVSSVSTVLAVDYTSFGRIAPSVSNRHEASLLREHLDSILERAVETLIITLVTTPTLAARFPPEDIDNLNAYWGTFGSTSNNPAPYFKLFDSYGTTKSHLNWSQFQAGWRSGQLGSTLEHTGVWTNPSARLLATLTDSTVDKLDPTRMSAADLLGVLAELAHSAGMQAVYVLVDRTDEPHPLAARPDLVADMLAPLIGELPLMECPRVSFKFFLPDEVARRLAEQAGVRLDRVLFRELKWETRYLYDLLSSRITAFSNGRISALGEICDSDLAPVIDLEIVNQALGVPRNLLRLAEDLIVVHCERAGEALLLAHSDWREALHRFHGLSGRPVFKAPAHPPLRLEKATHMVYVGVQGVSLPESQFTLLWYLAKQHGRIAPNHVLWQVAGSSDALRTAVRRIRQTIEADSKNPVYLVTVRGQGLRLDNTLPVEDTQ